MLRDFGERFSEQFIELVETEHGSAHIWIIQIHGVILTDYMSYAKKYCLGRLFLLKYCRCDP
ncbi:MAG: hypothetical protein GQF41_1623 [Candidatus Rifleibacterium amylolyticum]|nr:MAG: hypothetical protein GQF41_1623 [Candidatus Rifleibacterium amylolyticum]